MSKIVVLKRKAKGFFKPEDVATIHEAVNTVHDIITNTSILLKAYYLDWFENKTNGSKPLEVDANVIATICSVVQGSKGLQSRKPRSTKPIPETLSVVEKEKLEKKQEKKNQQKQDKKEIANTVFEKASFINENHFAGCLTVRSKLSLSHVLAYSFTTLETAYKNNISAHFLKYPKRYIKCDLISKGIDVSIAKKISAIISNYYFYRDVNQETVEEDILEVFQVYDENFLYKTLFPEFKVNKKDPKPRCYDIEVDPWKYLEKMVHINRDLEIKFADVDSKHNKLLSPLPFHSSFIPMSIRLDTSGLGQLLMTKEKIDDFKMLYKLENNSELNIKNKSDLLSSFVKVHGRQPNSKFEEGNYATDLWSFLTNLKTCRQWKELQNMNKKGTSMCFDNSIVTDGVTVSFQMIDKDHFGRKEFIKSRQSKTPQDDNNTKEAPKNQNITNNLQTDCKKLGLDPGKKDILAVTDGYTTLCYTSGQRKHDTFSRIYDGCSSKKRKYNNFSDFESTEMNQFCKKSCIIETFVNYCSKRLSRIDDANKIYRDTFYREFKFTKYCRTKSSENKFANKMKKTFGVKNDKVGASKYKAVTFKMKENAEKEGLELVIGWGNWGSNPNALKGCSPTPGIGIRRRFEKWFKTKTINEYGSSQQCPCCQTEKSLKKVTMDDNEIHHLLRCTNEVCQCRLWNRNVVGSFNILNRFIEEYKDQSLDDESSQSNAQGCQLGYLNLESGTEMGVPTLI